MPLVSRTRAILRRAEFGFLGVVVDTLMHTPRLNGLSWNVLRFLTLLMEYVIAGDFDFRAVDFRGRLMSWLMVATGVENRI